MRVLLSSLERPDYGAVTVPFPLEREEYDNTVEMLSALEIGDAVKQDYLTNDGVLKLRSAM